MRAHSFRHLSRKKNAPPLKLLSLVMLAGLGLSLLVVVSMMLLAGTADEDSAMLRGSAAVPQPHLTTQQQQQHLRHQQDRSKAEEREEGEEREREREREREAYKGEIEKQGEPFVCDGGKQLPAAFVNDEYCDCKDGSDEPKTGACNVLRFVCATDGKAVFSSRVNDGICDCCDGSDEYKKLVKCTNTCKTR